MLSAGSAHALDKVRVGKAVATSFAFNFIEVGIEAKTFESEGLELEVAAFRGDAQLQQAMASDAVDVGLGSGPSMGFRAKGAPALAVAVLAGRPQNMALLVAPTSPIKTVADLKGRRIGVTTAGSLTDWLLRELSRQQGWGPEGIDIMAMGLMRTRLAAMAAGEIDGTVQELANGYELEGEHRAKILLVFGNLVTDFYTHVIFATDKVIAEKPDLLRRFLRGWFKTIAYAKAHRDETVRSEAKTGELSLDVTTKTYDVEMAMMSDDGAFAAAPIETIRRSLKELGILDTVPDAKILYTDRFVPVTF